eukprot:PhF_6_TR1523/c0_g1_i2/m.2780
MASLTDEQIDRMIEEEMKDFEEQRHQIEELMKSTQEKYSELKTELEALKKNKEKISAELQATRKKNEKIHRQRAEMKESSTVLIQTMVEKVRKSRTLNPEMSSKTIKVKSSLSRGKLGPPNTSVPGNHVKTLLLLSSKPITPVPSIDTIRFDLFFNQEVHASLEEKKMVMLDVTRKVLGTVAPSLISVMEKECR